MQRIDGLLSDQPSSKKTSSPCQSGLFTPSVLESSISLFAPMHYEGGYAYPLLIWLHEAGADEDQLRRIIPLISLRNYVAVAPRGCSRPSSANSPRVVYDWPQTDDGITETEEHLFRAMEIAEKKYHVSRRRIFLAGCRDGGTMAFRIALMHPSYFAGAISLAGSLPDTQAPLSHLPLARRVPFFLATGRHNDAATDQILCNNLRLLHAAGMSITLRQYPTGSDLSPQMLGDVDRWIIDQITAEKNLV